MSKGIPKKHGKEFKLKVTLAAIKSDKTAAELCHTFGVAASQMYAWKKLLEEEGAKIFADKRQTEDQKNEIDKLHRIIGKIAAEHDFLSRVLDR